MLSRVGSKTFESLSKNDGFCPAAWKQPERNYLKDPKWWVKFLNKSCLKRRSQLYALCLPKSRMYKESMALSRWDLAKPPPNRLGLAITKRWLLNATIICQFQKSVFRESKLNSDFFIFTNAIWSKSTKKHCDTCVFRRRVKVSKVGWKVGIKNLVKSNAKWQSMKFSRLSSIFPAIAQTNNCSSGIFGQTK